MDKVQKAIELAVQYHAGQYRKEHNAAGNKIPFIVHPIQVMKTVFDWGVGTPVNLAATACHDILEDTDIDPDVLRSAIGDEAYFIVKELTFEEQPKGVIDHTEPALVLTKDQYMRTFSTKSVNALVIKMADRYCNVHDFLNSGDVQYARKYRDKAGPLYYAVQDRSKEIVIAYGSQAEIALHCAIDKLWNI